LIKLGETAKWLENKRELINYDSALKLAFLAVEE
jgi:hypothetical protein